MTFSADFPNAQPPQLLPLRKMAGTGAQSADYESEIRQLFLDLFNQYLASDAFDVNVLGMAHLGTFPLIQRSINFDGLTLLNNAYEQQAGRYIYKAWKSRAKRGRGLFFLRTYLQLLLPHNSRVNQQIAPISQISTPYPTILYDRPSTPIPSGYFLTSRLNVKLNVAGVYTDISSISSCISKIIPARFIPNVSSWLFSESDAKIAAVGDISTSIRASSPITLGFPADSGLISAQFDIVSSIRAQSIIN